MSAATAPRSSSRPISRVRGAGRGARPGLLTSDDGRCAGTAGSPASASAFRRSAVASGPGSTPSSCRNRSAIRSSERRAVRPRPWPIRSPASSRCASSSSGSAATRSSNRPAALQQLQVAQPQPGPRLLGPGLVEVVGQQVAAVVRHGLSGDLRPGVGPRGVGGAVELVHVDRDVGVGEQRHGAAREDDALARPERRTGVVGRHVQPRAGLVEEQVRPERVDDLVAQEVAIRLEREQLDQARGGASVPARGRDRAAVHGHVEAAEQTDVDAHRHPPPPGSGYESSTGPGAAERSKRVRPGAPRRGRCRR